MSQLIEGPFVTFKGRWAFLRAPSYLPGSQNFSPSPPLVSLVSSTHLNCAMSLHSSTLGRRLRHSSLVCATFSGHSLAMIALSSSVMVFSAWKISCSVCGDQTARLSPPARTLLPPPQEAWRKLRLVQSASRPVLEMLLPQPWTPAGPGRDLTLVTMML
jgi:hypothetical protein